MNKINKILLTLILLLSFSYAKADCSEEELTKLKEEADKIEITYKHLGKYTNEIGEEFYDRFNVKVINISNDFYIIIDDNSDDKLAPQNNSIEKRLITGSWKFNIYSNKCTEKIDSIDVKIPKFNMYSLDPLCEGVDGEDFELCGKYYNYYISYEDFKQRVERYRYINKIGIENGQNNKKENSNLINKIFELIKPYKIYILYIVPSIIIFIVLIYVILKRKNRGVLK